MSCFELFFRENASSRADSAAVASFSRKNAVTSNKSNKKPISSNIFSDCREVVKAVCVNTPKKVTNTVPVTSCTIKQSVDCTPVVNKVPKQVCEPVETEVVAPAVAPYAAAPLGYGAGYLW